MSPYLLRLLLPKSCPMWGVPRDFTTADLHRQIRADERYNIRLLPEVQAADRRAYAESVRLDDAAEYASECAAAAAYEF